MLKQRLLSLQVFYLLACAEFNSNFLDHNISYHYQPIINSIDHKAQAIDASVSTFWTKMSLKSFKEIKGHPGSVPWVAQVPITMRNSAKESVNKRGMSSSLITLTVRKTPQ